MTDRFDIAEAHAVLEWDYNVGGWLRERPTNKRRMEATSYQLDRIGFHARADLCYDTLTEDGKEVYLTNVMRLRLPMDEGLRGDAENMFVPEYLGAIRSDLWPEW